VGRLGLFQTGAEAAIRAFSSEVDTGSLEENAKKQKLRVISRFNQNGNCSSQQK
jgi:hypothetical protein